jgi:siroheme synthase
MTWLKSLLTREPAVILYGLAAALSVAASFGLPLTHLQEAAAVTIITAVASAAAAFMTRPVEVSAITAALATALAAAGTFGLHLSAGEAGALVAVVSVVLMHVLRQNVSPASSAKLAVSPLRVG